MRGRLRQRLERLEARAPEPKPKPTAPEELTAADVVQIVLNEFRSGRVRFVGPARVEMATGIDAGHTAAVCEYVTKCMAESPSAWVLLADHEYEQIERWLHSDGVKVWPVGWSGSTPYVWPGRETWDRWAIEPGAAGCHHLAQHFRCALENWLAQQQIELPEVKTVAMLREIFDNWKRDFDVFVQEQVTT